MIKGQITDKIMFKKVGQKKLSEETCPVNVVTKGLMTGIITQSNKVIKAASLRVNKQLGLQ